MKRVLSLLLALCLSLSLSVPAFAAEGGEEAAAEPMFSDIADHWAKDVILKYVDMGVINGYGNGTFQPDRVVTRAELSKILTLAFDLAPGEISYEDMQDPTVWYYPYAACADRYLPRYCPVGHVANPSLFWPYFVNFQNYNVFLPGAQVSRVHAAEALVEIALRQAGVVTEKGWHQYGAVYGGRQELIPGATDYEKDRYDWASVDMVKAMFPDDEQLASTVVPPRGGMNPSNQRRVYDYVWLAVQMGIMQGNDEGLFLPYNGITRAELLTIIDRVLTADPSSLVENLQTGPAMHPSPTLEPSMSAASGLSSTPDRSSTRYVWESGESFCFTSEAVGVKLELPPVWRYLITVEESRTYQYFLLDREEPVDCVLLVPKGLALERDSEKRLVNCDDAIGIIYWEPADMRCSADWGTYVVLKETGEGSWCCLLPGHKKLEFVEAADNPGNAGMLALYTLIEQGMENGEWELTALKK